MPTIDLSCLQERVLRRRKLLTNFVNLLAKVRAGVLPPVAVLRVQVGPYDYTIYSYGFTGGPHGRC
jgi:hypothetical protein